MKLGTIIDMPCLLTGAWSRFGVHLFHGKVTTSDIDMMERLGDAWFAKNPGRLVELVVVFPSDARLSSEERTRMTQLMKRREKDRIASATVILAEGLTGAVHRSVLTGLLLLARPPHPIKIFGTTKAAVTWLAPHVQTLCGATATADNLNAAVDELSGRFRARMK
jgi:hypothetical protein